MAMGTATISLLFLVLLMYSVEASLFSACAHREFEQMKIRVDMVHDKLISEKCPDPALRRTRRHLITSSNDVDYEIEAQLYKHLTDLLIECRKNKLAPTTTTEKSKTTLPTTTIPTTTIPTTTTPTTTIPTTTTVNTETTTPIPSECQTAINLTESWRLDHSGSKIKPVNGDYSRDPRDMIAAGRPWFRFTGNAGNKLADFCVPLYSCGSGATLWSNSTMPSSEGVVSRITIYAHGSSQICDYSSFRGSVMRCSSAANDLIYRYDDEYSGSGTYGFCGMNA